MGVSNSVICRETHFRNVRESTLSNSGPHEVRFFDVVQSDDVYICIRHFSSSVAVTISLKRNGDCEIFLGQRECDALRTLLEEVLDLEQP